MKNILIVRHAKSGYDFASNDFHRTLTEEGIEDLAGLRRFMSDKKIEYDCVLASPATRTRQTAEGINIAGKQVIFKPALYNAEVNTIVQVIQQTEDQYQSVVLVAHNPGLSELISMYSDLRLDHLPPGAAAFFSFPTDNWNDFGDNKLDFLYFHNP